MAWFVLVLSGILEAVWATALGRSEGFTRLVPSVVFGVALVVSMAGLAYAMRGLPVGTAYAVWVGIGASLTVLYAMARRGTGLAGQGGLPPGDHRRGGRTQDRCVTASSARRRGLR